MLLPATLLPLGTLFSLSAWGGVQLLAAGERLAKPLVVRGEAALVGVMALFFLATNSLEACKSNHHCQQIVVTSTGNLHNCLSHLAQHSVNVLLVSCCL